MTTLNLESSSCALQPFEAFGQLVPVHGYHPSPCYPEAQALHCPSPEDPISDQEAASARLQDGIQPLLRGGIRGAKVFRLFIRAEGIPADHQADAIFGFGRAQDQTVIYLLQLGVQ